MAKQVNEMTPVAKAAAAGVQGMDNEKIAGVRLGQAFIKADREKAEEAAKASESLKDRLVKLLKLTPKEHEAFAATLNEEREQMKARSKDAGYDKLADYFKLGGRNGQVDNYLQTSISMWLKFNSAMQKGWPISAERIKSANWQALSKEATDYKPPVTNAPTIPSDVDRRAMEAAAQKKLVEDASKFAEQHMTKRNEQGNLTLSDAAKSALPDAVLSIVKWASVEEIDACISKLQQYREVAVKAREEAAKATAQAAAKQEAKTEQPAQQEEPAPANVGQEMPAEQPKAKGKRSRATA